MRNLILSLTALLAFPVVSSAAPAVIDVATGSFAAAGDVNGDGYADALAFGYDATGGASFVFHGGPTGIGDVGPADAATRLGVGFDVAAGAGDVNGDGYDDLLVRTSDAVLLFHGSASGIPSGGATFAATTLMTLHDFARGAGDVNGDGYDDVVVGRWDAAFVFHGSASGVPSGDESDADTQIVPLTGDAFLEAAPAGDVDGDGYGDLLLRAERPNDVSPNQPVKGLVLVLGGGPSGIPDGDTSAATELLPNFTSQWYEVVWSSFESMAAAGDVNADGYDDVIVGDPTNDYWGAAFLYLGSAAGVPGGEAWAAASSGLRFLQEGATFGQHVDGAGDVNGDGYDDVVVSVPGYDGGQINEGAVFVFLGGEDGIPSVPYVPVRLESNQEDSSWFWAGVRVAGAGDVNGDGYDDVMAGASGGPVFVFHGLTCGNAVDDDGDGRTDFPADSGCSQAADLSERGGQLCDDGRDNDGDTFTDFPADPGCSKGNDASELSDLPCDNGLDDDGDGRRDLLDPGCESPADASERGAIACDNGVDDDADSFADFPADRGCSGPTDASERGTQICDDGIDNDLDALVDYPTDNGCRSVADLSEGISACDNGLDDDGDGLVDLGADPGCSDVADDSEWGPLACDNGLDDNQNGLTDYLEDPGCLSQSDASEEAIYDDGGSHVIDILIPGAVTVTPGWACSPSPFCFFCCGPSPTAISVVDGGSISGDVWLQNPALVEIAGGSVAGYVIAYNALCPFPPLCNYQLSDITLSAGRVGGWIEATNANVHLTGGTIDGGVWATGESSVELAGTEIAGGVDLEGTTSGRLMAGIVHGDLVTRDEATLSLLGGLVEGGVQVSGASPFVMTGGEIGGNLALHGSVEALITGGAVSGNLGTRDDAVVRVSGGTLTGAFVTGDQSVLEIVGHVPGLASGLVTAASGSLVGTLGDGGPLDVTFLRNPNAVLRVTGKRMGPVIDDFEMGYGMYSAGSERWLRATSSAIGDVRSSARIDLTGGRARFWRSGCCSSPRYPSYGTLSYDGNPNGTFDGSQGQLFADLTRGGTNSDFEVEVSELSLNTTATKSVGIDVFDRDSSASAAVALTALGVVRIPFSGFSGIDFTDVRALAINLSTFDGTIAISKVALSDDPLPVCDNGLDDDGDGRFDLVDPGCNSASDGSERGTGACDDGLDNDGDSRIDAGPGAANDPGCTDIFDANEHSTKACDNGVDDDGDTKVDWLPNRGGDDGCFGLSDPDESSGTSCGLGPELALLVPLLAAVRRRLRFAVGRTAA